VAAALLNAMGWETANVHLGSVTAAILVDLVSPARRSDKLP
jgi:hypothetical protein